jgi:hypothetical protein
MLRAQNLLTVPKPLKPIRVGYAMTDSGGMWDPVSNTELSVSQTSENTLISLGVAFPPVVALP